MTHIEVEVTFGRKGARRYATKRSTMSGAPDGANNTSGVGQGRVAKVVRLLALAHRLDDLVRSGATRNLAEVARAGRVTRARVSQITALLNLAPDIQAEILALPMVTSGRDPMSERDLRPIAAEPDWSRQRGMWKNVRVRNLDA